MKQLTVIAIMMLMHACSAPPPIKPVDKVPIQNKKEKHECHSTFWWGC